MKRLKMLSLLVAAAALALAVAPAAPAAASDLADVPASASALTSGDYAYDYDSNGNSTITGYNGSAPDQADVPAASALTAAPDAASALTDVPASASALTSGDYTYSCDSDGNATITGYNGSATDLVVPSTIGGHPVTSIGYSAFYSCPSLISVTIPEGVTSIGDDAFSNCFSLTSVTLPEGVTSIGRDAFIYCESLVSITLPEGVASIGNEAFRGCKSLPSITLPSTVTSVGGYAFDGCSSLASISVSPGNTSYASYDGVLYTKGYGTLVCCPGGKASITWPEGVTSIGEAAFYKCGSLTSATIPEGVTSIGAKAFHDCESLASITIPKSVTSIGDGAFYNCRSLISATIPEGVTSIEDFTFYWCDSLTSVTIPKSVTSIGNVAFDWCRSLTDVYYAGSRSQWAKISADWGNDLLYESTIHYNSSGPSSGGSGGSGGSSSPDRAWTRLAGADRFGTMKAITLEGYESADTVLVATGADFADALAAAGLSGVLDAPVVTTKPGALSAEARETIKALGAKEAVILGGTKAVSADVEKQLRAMGLKVSRLAGDNRVDTAVRIWKRGGSAWGDTCILSKGWVSADALAAGSFAYADSAPIFLAMPDGTLTPDTAKAVKSFDYVVVLGGTAGNAAISDKTAKSLGVSWMRVAGDTRYETATAFATWASGGNARAAFQPETTLSWNDCAVAFAWNYPDALVGVNATGPKSSVTLLASTDVDNLTKTVSKAVGGHAAAVSHGYVLGGTAVISDAVKRLFENAAK